MLQKRICFVIPYFGSFPVWFNAFLLSCKHNPQLDWIIFSDKEHRKTSIIPDNVQIKKMTLEEFLVMAGDKLAHPVRFDNPKKMCDLKPMFGAIFSEDLKFYDYWGHCDLDVIWGDITGFLKRIDFQKYLIITTRKRTICGHFTLYRNTSNINFLFQNVKNYHKILIDNLHHGFDEGYFSYYLRMKEAKGDSNISIFWPRKYSVDWPELDINPNGWFWRNGKIYGSNGVEREYLHFMNWKKSLKKIDFDFSEAPLEFSITKYGLWSQKPDLKSRVLLKIPFHLRSRFLCFYRRCLAYIKCRIFKIDVVPIDLIPANRKVIE